MNRRSSIQPGGQLSSLHTGSCRVLFRTSETPLGRTEVEPRVFADLKCDKEVVEIPEWAVGSGKRGLFVLSFLVIILLLAVSCEPYEPVLRNGSYPTESDAQQENQLKLQGQQISAFADGAEFVLYFSSDEQGFKPLYKGDERYTGNIELPDIAPLDLWLVTTPVTQDSVWLELGCIHVSSVNRIRMVIRR